MRHRRKIFLLDVCSLDARQAVQPDPLIALPIHMGSLHHAFLLFATLSPSIYSISTKPFRTPTCACDTLKADGGFDLQEFTTSFFKICNF